MDKASNELKWIEPSNTWSWIPTKNGPLLPCFPKKCLPNRWIEKKTIAMIIISFYIHLPISICTISSISAIVACILTTYITPPTIIEVWNQHVKYIIRLRVFGGFGSQGGACWNRWYRYPDPGLSILKANTLLQLGEGWLRHLLSHTFQTHRAPSTCIYGSKMLGAVKCDYLRLDMFKSDSLMSIGAYISETHLHSDTKNKSSNDIKSHEATMNQTFSDNPLIHRLCVLIL